METVAEEESKHNSFDEFYDELKEINDLFESDSY